VTAADARQLRAALVAGCSLARAEAYAPFAGNSLNEVVGSDGIEPPIVRVNLAAITGRLPLPRIALTRT